MKEEIYISLQKGEIINGYLERKTKNRNSPEECLIEEDQEKKEEDQGKKEKDSIQKLRQEYRETKRYLERIKKGKNESQECLIEEVQDEKKCNCLNCKAGNQTECMILWRKK